MFDSKYSHKHVHVQFRASHKHPLLVDYINYYRIYNKRNSKPRSGFLPRHVLAAKKKLSKAYPSQPPSSRGRVLAFFSVTFFARLCFLSNVGCTNLQRLMMDKPIGKQSPPPTGTQLLPLRCAAGQNIVP